MPLRRFIAVLLILWLPIQTAGAAVMPFCKHLPRGAEHARVAEHASERVAASPCDGHVHDKSDVLADDSNKLPCDQCDLCRLACAGFMPASIALPHGPAVSVAVGEVPQSFRSAVAVLADRPPLPTPR